MREIIYRLEDITKNYHLNKVIVPALKGINLEIEKEDSLAFVGPSGSGKSTVLHILGSIDKPSSGKVYFENQNLDSKTDKELSSIRASKIGFIFQSFNLIQILNVYENIEYPLRIQNKKMTKEVKDKIFSIIEEVGLKDFIKHRPGELSGGQRQRVAIARALVIDPIVILADEPTANLDSKTGIKILELLRKLGQKYGSTIIFSTHDQKVIDYVDTKVFLNDGLITGTEKK